MKSPFSVLLLTLGLLGLSTSQEASTKSVIISFPQGTPENVVDEAKNAVLNAGGVITHEYNIFPGFAATAPVSVFEQIGTMSAQYHPNIEDDQVMTIQ